jgi:hypothetical protein
VERIRFAFWRRANYAPLMCRLRNVLTSRKWSVAAPVVVLGLAAGATLLWWVEDNRNGTLTLDCPDDSFAIEIRTDRPPTKWETISGSDVSPQLSDWGGPTLEMRSRRCVWFREVERCTVDIKLPPGEYTICAHRKSPCGHYGGDAYKTLKVEEGGRVVTTLRFVPRVPSELPVAQWD